ncbi:MAG: TetR/AcrR family transcriptional regulator C-terminal domain-containing protein [Chloroflexota bacterium]|nr:TetR/AcrR family transcriptional regulator C-terminal domain-containing protein [Chloroflexota bacterium]
MATQPDQLQDRRAPLTRERVLRAAIGLADAGGIEALSMRRLAQELGVEAMSLYYHVANKSDMLDAIVDMVVGEIELPPPDVEWKVSIRTTATSAHEILVRHPWAANLVLSGSGLSMARLRYMESILGALRRAGFSPEMTDHAYHALDSHIMGFTLWLVGMNLGSDDDLKAMAGDFLSTLSVTEFPYLAEHIEQHLKPADADDVPEFEFGLDLILDGLERMLPDR